MSLLLAYTFNEQSTTPWDYSGGKQTGSAANVTFVAGQNYGFAAKIGQGADLHSYVRVTPTNFSGLGAFTMFTSFNLIAVPNPGSLGYIAYATGAFDIHLNATGNIVFALYNGTTTVSVMSAGTIFSGWHTIGCVYDGTTIYIYIDGVVDANTGSQSGTMGWTGGTVLYIGNDISTDNANTLVANMDCIEFRSIAMDAIDISNLNSSPGGVQVIETPNNFAMGDLIADSALVAEAVVTWVVDTDTFYVYPLTDFSAVYIKIGNIGTAARQYYMEMLTDFDSNGNGQIKISYPIAGWADYSSPANTITFDKNGYSGSATPSGSAGGSLSGTYPNPGIASSVNLPGNPTTTTQSNGDSSTKVATDAFVINNLIALGSLNHNSFSYNGSTKSFGFNTQAMYNCTQLLTGANIKWSIAAWINTASISTIQEYFAIGNGAGIRSISLGVNASGQLVVKLSADGTTANYSFWTDGSALNANTAYQVVVTYDGTLTLASRINVYVNGSSRTMTRTDVGTGLTNIFTPASSGNNTSIGLGWTTYWHGNIGEIDFWSSVLNIANITAIYNSGTPIDLAKNVGNYSAVSNLIIMYLPSFSNLIAGGGYEMREFFDGAGSIATGTAFANADRLTTYPC